MAKTDADLARRVRIEVWSDIGCPWCWLGKRHLEQALEQTGTAADIRFRSFELDPRAGPTKSAREYLIGRFGSAAAVDAAQGRLRAMGEQAGLSYDFERARVANTFDAHRLHHFAKSQGLGDVAVERLMRAYHSEGADLADHETLRALASEIGLDAKDVEALLASDAHARDVREDEAAAHAVGVQGVPFFVFDGRYAVSGAQPVDAFVQVLRKVAQEA